MYLHNNYIDGSILSNNFLQNNEKYVLLRFVSWEAHHDNRQKGFSYDEKVSLVNYLSRNYKLLISSENELPEFLKKYRYDGPSYLMHAVIKNSCFIITEGATLASEAVVLGIPAVYMNTIQNGNSIDQNDHELLYIPNSFPEVCNAIDEIKNIINDKVLLLNYKNKWIKYLENKIDMTAFLVWFMENWPKSLKIMKENPDYQYKFR